MVLGVTALLQETTAIVPDTSTGFGSSELLSGFLGALFVFILGIVRSALRRRRERIALMTLVHHEIMQNQRLIEEDIREPYPLTRELVGSLHDDVWKENRARIAQLEDERAVEYLGMYYTSIGTLTSVERRVWDQGDHSHLEDAKFMEIFDATRKNLGPLARYVCERQTRVVRAWSNGMLVVVGEWQPEKTVEDNWYRRDRGPHSDEDEET